MALHDWSDERGWDSVHAYWLNRLFHGVKAHLPESYRAYLGSVPGLSVHGGGERADLAVRHWLPEPPLPPEGAADFGATDTPDIEVATLTIDPQTGLYVTYQGRMVAALELISPRNKDRPSARQHYLYRYLGYLKEGVNLVLVDVLPHPKHHSFADAMAAELALAQPPTPAPFAVAYRVGEPAATGGRLVAIWRRPMAIGKPLPKVPLPLTVHASVEVDLETTYLGAAEDAYLA